MSSADRLNLAGIVVTGFGSTLAMFGAYMQMNGYFAFRPGKLFDELRRILWCFARGGWTRGRRRIVIAATLARNREDRATALIGFYCVLFGFFFQMLGSIILAGALLHGAGETRPAEHVGGIACPGPGIELQQARKQRMEIASWNIAN